MGYQKSIVVFFFENHENSGKKRLTPEEVKRKTGLLISLRI